MRPHRSEFLHEFFNAVPGFLAVSAVSQAKVPHCPDEVVGVSCSSINYPAFAASHDQQVDSALAESCYEVREAELPIHMFDDMWIVKPLVN